MIAKRVPIEHINLIKEELEVSPLQNIYVQKEVIFPVYSVVKDYVYVPKFWPPPPCILKEISMVDFNEFNKIDIEFTGNLRDDQTGISYDIERVLLEKKGVILSLPCGYGKTVIAINIIQKMGLKTLVIVNKSFLMDQWRQNLEKFSTSRVGELRQNKMDVENKDVVVGMLQSISSRSYPKDLFKQFDMVIVDEVHNIATKMFSRALLKIRCKYSMGLSATPERKDGLSKIYKWFLGDTVYSIPNIQKKKVLLSVKNFKSTIKEESKLFLTKKLYNGNINISSMITNLSMSNERNTFIASLIPKSEERFTLLLSSRLEQLSCIKDIFEKSNPLISCSFYIGKMKREDLKISEEAQIIFATYEMVNEGFDLPKLNCIVLATPRTEVEQSVGRILRSKTSLDPLILDICDIDVGVFISQHKKRVKFYKSKYDIL